MFRQTNYVLALFVITATFIMPVAQSDDAEIADKYMKAYSHFDVDEMSKYYSPDAKFRDPTSEIWGEHAWNMDGKDKIIERLRSFHSQFDRFTADYNVRDKYESAGHTVYTGTAKYTEMKDGTLETTCVRISTIVSVKDGKVTEHRDYIDYDNLDPSKKAGDQDC